MKRGTIEHPKMEMLAKLLCLPRYAAVGIMESFWHMTMKYHPTGEIHWPAEMVAQAIGWDRGAAELLQALIDCRWVDSDNGKLLVHDWLEHADQGAKRRAVRWSRHQSETDNVRQELYMTSHVQSEIDENSKTGPSAPAPAPAPAPALKTPPTPLEGGRPDLLPDFLKSKGKRRNA